MELTLNQALQKGVEAHKAGKIQEADRYYTAILKADPKHPDANHNLGVLAVCVGKVEAALPFFKTALEANPSINQYWLSYINALITLNKTDHAKATLDKARSKGLEGDGFDKLEKKLSQNWPVDSKQTNKEILGKAKNLLEDGKHDDAINLLSNQTKQLPKDPNILSLLSQCYILNNNLEQAKIYLEAAKDINPSIASVGWNETRLLLKQKKVSEALAVAGKTHTLFPDDVEGVCILGSCLRANGNFNESLKYLNRAIELNPNYAEALIHRGLIYLTNKDTANAQIDLEKAHRLKPHVKQIWKLVLNLKIQAKEYQEAISLAEEMVKLEPLDEKYFATIAICYQQLNNFDKTVDFYKKAISLKPDYAEAHYNMAYALQNQGKLDEAIEAYQKVLSIEPDYAEAYNNMGAAFRDLGKLEAAIEVYDKALFIQPNNVEAHLNLGNALKDLGKLGEALEAYTKAIALKPDYAEAHNNIGVVLKDLGKLEEAIQAYKKAILIQPDFNNAWNNLYFPLHTIKNSYDKNLSVTHSKNVTSNDCRIAQSILDYKLHRGHESEGIYLDKAISSLSTANNIAIKNQSFDEKYEGNIQSLPNKIVALVHFGRSGTGLMHSLIDGHPEVSTLPSVYFSEYFDDLNWLRIISDGWDQMVDRFISIYEVLFNASSPVPVESKGKQLLYNIGIKEGMTNLGDQRDEVLSVNKVLFKNALRRLMKSYKELNAFTFFKLVHSAYNTAINDENSKNLIFYHIHNPDTCAQLNFAGFNAENNWIIMVREPLQSCEAWVSRVERKNLHSLHSLHSKVSSIVIHTLFEIDNIIYSRQNSIGIRLEDIKKQPEKTIKALCLWIGIEETKSLYEMTAQGKKWWGDPSSPDYSKDGMEPFGKTSIKRKVGAFFSENDQFILRTLFYPFSVRFGYTDDTKKQFKRNLEIIRPMLDNLFDFEKKIIEETGDKSEQFMRSGSFRYFRTRLIERWDTLHKFGTYPNVISALKI